MTALVQIGSWNSNYMAVCLNWVCCRLNGKLLAVYLTWVSFCLERLQSCLNPGLHSCLPSCCVYACIHADAAVGCCSIFPDFACNALPIARLLTSCNNRFCCPCQANLHLILSIAGGTLTHESTVPAVIHCMTCKIGPARTATATCFYSAAL